MEGRGDLSQCSREELLNEISKRDNIIAHLNKEIQRFQHLFHARKIAVSAEGETKPPPKIIQKNKKTRDTIESAFLVNELLCHLDRQQIEEIIQSMYPLDACPDSMIVRQGEHGSQLFVLEEGRVQVSKDNQFLRMMEAPCVFGELAILYHCERTASVKAVTQCRLWAIERKNFHSINVHAAKSKHNEIFSSLKRSGHFTSLPDNCLHLIADLVTEEDWKHRSESSGNQFVGRIFQIANGNIAVRRAAQFGSPAEMQQVQLPSSDGFGDALPLKSSDSLSQVELSDLKTVSTLGIGGFGRVNLVKHVPSDRVYALKILNKAHVTEKNQQEHVVNERNIMISCRSDFIVKLYRSYRDSERLYMLMEYCSGGEVWTMLRNWGRFDEQTARFYCAAALEAFDYLHRHLIIYRDLKPENMLLDKNGVPKLADFGFAKCLKTDSGRTFTFCGTAEYVAPEIILNKGQGLGVDLWALGIFMYELISGTPPFASTDPMYTYASILKGVQTLAWPKYFSDSAKALICKFCRKEPAQRLGYGRIEDARRDPWFQGFDFVSFRNHTMRPPIKPTVRCSTDTQNFDRFPSFDNFSTGVDDSGWDFDF